MLSHSTVHYPSLWPSTLFRLYRTVFIHGVKWRSPWNPQRNQFSLIMELVCVINLYYSSCCWSFLYAASFQQYSSKDSINYILGVSLTFLISCKGCSLKFEWNSLGYGKFWNKMDPLAYGNSSIFSGVNFTCLVGMNIGPVCPWIHSWLSRSGYDWLW